MDTLETVVQTTSDTAAPVETFAVYNPATGAKLAELPVMTPGQVEKTVARAKVAQQEWAAMSFKTRRTIMFRWRSKLIANKKRIEDTLVAENGKFWLIFQHLDPRPIQRPGPGPQAASRFDLCQRCNNKLYYA